MTWRAIASDLVVESCPVPRMGVQVLRKGEWFGYKPLIASPLNLIDYVLYAGPSPKDGVVVYTKAIPFRDSDRRLELEVREVIGQLKDDGYIPLATVHMHRSSTSIPMCNITNLTKEANE